MAGKFVTFMVIPHNEDHVREFNITRPLIWAFASVALLGALLFGYFTYGYYEKAIVHFHKHNCCCFRYFAAAHSHYSLQLPPFSLPASWQPSIYFMRSIHDRVRKGLNALDYMMLIAEKFQAPGVVGHGVHGGRHVRRPDGELRPDRRRRLRLPQGLEPLRAPLHFGRDLP